MGGNAGETPAGTFGGILMYDYHFTLPTPFQATAGVKYWVQIEASQGLTPNYYWPPDWSIAVGTGGDGSHFQRTTGATLAGGNLFQTLANDLTFTLLGSDAPTVTIAAIALPTGGGTVRGDGPYPLGATASLVASPNAGYGFVNWTEGGSQVSASATYNFVATTGRTLVANFTPAYSITTSASPNYGGATSGGGNYNSGASVTVVASPATGYAFVNWTEFGTPVNATASYTFAAGANRSLVANFAGTSATSVFDFDPGNPAVGVHQGMPGSQVDNGLTAYFSAPSGAYSIQQYIFYTWIPASFSGLFLWPNTWGSTLQIQFSQPVTNVSFNFATDDLASETDIPSFVQVTAYTNSTATPPLGSAKIKGAWISGAYPEGALTYSSSTPFNIVRLAIPSGQFASLLFVDNIVAQRPPPPADPITAAASPANGGTVSGAGAYSSGANVTLVATPNTGYVFVDWTEAGIEVSAAASYTFTANGSRTLVANFGPAFTITANASPAASGTISGDGAYAAGALVAVTATANPGYAFVNWTENGVRFSTWPSCYLTVNTNRALVATFAPACVITTSTASTNAGLASGGGIYPERATVQIAAAPNTGYRFLNWTEAAAVLSASPSYYFAASSNRTIVANFTNDNTSVTFDFNTAAPALTNDQDTPFEQTARGLTAHFSSPADPAFCVHNDATTGWSMSGFSSNYLFTCFAAGDLNIHFSQPVSSIALAFATADFQEIITPTTIQLTAYRNSGAAAVGVVTTCGSYNPADTAPMGWIGFRSTVPFDQVNLTLPPAPMAATDFMVDSIVVATVPQLRLWLTATNTAVVSWTTNSDGYLLQHNTECHTTNWVAVTSPIQVVGDQNQVIISPPVGNRFYRLMHP